MTRKAPNLALIHTVTSISHRLSSQLTEPVYILRKERHEQAITPIHGGKEETLLLYHSTDSTELILTITPHKRLIPRHDEHIMWRDEKDDVYRLDAGAFTISEYVGNSELDYHFSAPGETNKTEGSEV